MAQNTDSLRINLRELKRDFKLLQEDPCTAHETVLYKNTLKNGNSLPEGIYTDDNDVFYKLRETDLTEKEIREYIALKQLSMIKTIKNCVLFFTVLTVIGICVFLFSLLK